MFRTSNFLRWVLFFDAATCVGSGVLMMAGAGTLEQQLGLPAGLSRYAGFSLVPFAGFLLYLATRKVVSPTLVWAAILLNALWTADSFLLLLSGWVSPTEIGYGLVVAQALGVAVLAGLEYVGLRKSMALAV